MDAGNNKDIKIVYADEETERLMNEVTATTVFEDNITWVKWSDFREHIDKKWNNKDIIVK